ncbi:hypothetical protein ACFY3M_55080 [Streptomyces mirabilis]|uniref:hypothetical protein n=1 Tax=Streptomyces mirabilis TaxID=68239 RepID=UPI00368D00A2
MLLPLGPGRAKYLEGQEGLSTEDTSLDDLDLGVLDEMVLDRDLLLTEALRALQERHEMDDPEMTGPGTCPRSYAIWPRCTATGRWGRSD